MSQLSQNVPTISKCPNSLRSQNFHQRVNQIFLKNYSLSKNQDCAEMCSMTEFMRNYAENVKTCENVR